MRRELAMLVIAFSGCTLTACASQSDGVSADVISSSTAPAAVLPTSSNRSEQEVAKDLERMLLETMPAKYDVETAVDEHNQVVAKVRSTKETAQMLDSTLHLQWMLRTIALTVPPTMTSNHEFTYQSKGDGLLTVQGSDEEWWKLYHLQIEQMLKSGDQLIVDTDNRTAEIKDIALEPDRVHEAEACAKAISLFGYSAKMHLTNLDPELVLRQRMSNCGVEGNEVELRAAPKKSASDKTYQELSKIIKEDSLMRHTEKATLTEDGTLEIHPGNAQRAETVKQWREKWKATPLRVKD